jgi:hypothetical protein
MAILYPSALPNLKQNGGRFRELDVIDRLQQSLPEHYEIFHSVPLHSIQSDADHFGEIDVVVLDPVGKILLMEVKAGSVVVRDGGVFKLYANKEHDIGRQCKVQYGAMRNRLLEAGIRTTVNTCLVIPDYSINDAHILSIPQERIIDADKYANLGTWVREFLSAGTGCTDLPALRQFLRNEFRVTTDLAVMRDQVQRTVRQLSDGLASWVPRITSPSGNIRIQATAGSGKTQLALQLLESAVAQSRSVAYVCYNRSLADHLRSIAPPRATITNFHEMCVDHFRRHHEEPDFSHANVFETVTLAYIEASVDFEARFDVLVIDEGQDFEPAWLESVCMLLKDDGQLFLMEDDDQRLYDRPKFDLQDTVHITCRDNYRSPRLICDVINALGLTATSIQSKNPYQGSLPGFHTYKTDRELITQTARAIAELQAQGFALSDIVVLSGRGRSKSALLSADKIGPYKTKHVTGEYTRDGDPIWSEGDLMVESVYRYKGQSAPAIVLSEVSFTELTPIERRKLFVGMTRAQMAVEIVLTGNAEKSLMAIFNSEV